VVLRGANCLLNRVTNVKGRVATDSPGKGGRSSNIDNREDCAAAAIVCVGGCAARNSGYDSVCSCDLIGLPFTKVTIVVLVYVAHDCFQVSWPKKSSNLAEVDQTIRVEGCREMEMVNCIRGGIG
jgi:hypothetical protein